PVSGVTLDSDTLYLNTGQTIQLTATVTPGDATNRAVTWQAAGDDATVDQTGTVTAVKAGEARVTVTTADGGFTYGCTVRVNTSQITFVARAANLPYLALAGNGETSEYQSPPWN
ncbi:MAG: Ig-like domain-containing protein, partial [Bacteroidales bacterium]|nr:Ig-like domain-containing protein [Bacteroidales bacterium]